MLLVEVNSAWKTYPRSASLRTGSQTLVENVSLFFIEAGETVELCASPLEACTRQLMAAAPALPAGAA